MKNLISYKKSGPNALRKAFSFIVLLCGFIQSSIAQDYVVDGWWNMAVGGNEASRVVPVDECGSVYHVYVVKAGSGVAKFGIKYPGGKGGVKSVSSSISKTDLVTENDFEGKGLCQFTLPEGSTLKDFYIDMSKSPYNLTESAPADVDVIKITPSTTSSVNLGSKMTFTSKFCSSNQNTELTYQWKVSNGSTWINPSTTNTESTFEYIVLTDIKEVKCVATYKDPLGEQQTIESNVISISTNEPTFDVEIIGTEGIRNVNSKEKEVPSWRDVVIKMVDLPSSNVSNPKISFKGLGKDESYKPFTKATLNEDNSSWSLYSDTTGWIKIEADVEVPASDGTATTATLKKEFLFRLVYSPDKEDAVQELFYDDFGYFVGNDYHYVKYEEGKVVDEDAVETVDPKLPSNVKWMDDQNGFISKHKFALLDPRTERIPLDENGNPDRNTANCWSKPSENQPYICWCENGYRVEDGYYAFVSDPAMADGGGKTGGGSKDYWAGTDHTGNNDGTKHGAMLMVNCAKDALDAIIYERDFEITGECSNVMVLFSAFVSNAQGIIPAGGATPVNIRMDIYEKGGTKVLTSIESGDVITRNYGANSWSNLTALFPLSTGDSDNSKYYTLKITNNAPSGSGNDILLDDISLKVCFPEIEVTANVLNDEILEKNKIVICGKNRNLTLTAFNRAGIKNYIPTPSYLFQYFDDANNKWINLPKSAADLDDAIQDNESIDIVLGKDGFNGDTKFRVIVGNSVNTIKKLVSEGIKAPNCEYTYAISDTFFVMFKPVGENLDLFGCIGDTIKIDADANGRTPEWYDYAGNPLALNDSIIKIDGDKVEFVIPESILNLADKSDTIYMVGIADGGLCKDTQFVSITKYDDLEFNIANEEFYCEFGGYIRAISVKPENSVNYTWTLLNSNLEPQTGNGFEIKKSTPEIFDNTVVVTGTALGYCPRTDTATYSIYRRYSLDLTVDVEGKNEKVANVCLPTDGESSSRVDLTVKKIYADGSQPTYADEKVTTYFWYRKDGAGDSVLIGQGPETSLVDRLTENNVYKYSVTAIDEVCYNNEGVATSDSTIINARKPLIVKLSEDKTELCKDEDITLTVKLTNSLKSDTITSRFYENDGALTSLVGFPLADTTNEYNYVPTNTTKEKLTKDIRVEVMDMICSPSTPVSDQVSFDVFVPLVVSLSTDANNGTKCIRKDLKDDSVNVTLTVEQGNPRLIEWFDNLYPGLVYKRPVTVSASNNGINTISVKAFDQVCRASEASGFVKGADTSIVVTAQEPIEISITADKESICNGESLEFNMNVTNSLTRTPEVRWYELYEGADALINRSLIESTTKTYTPVNDTKFMVEKTMIVKTTDDICNSGNDISAQVSYKIFIPIKLQLLHDADLNGNTIQKCITQDNVDNVVNLTVKVTEGNPSVLTWSDNKYEGLVFSRELKVSPGSNPISVVGSDGVCPASANDNDDLDIVAATPITLELKANNPDVCDGSDVEFELKVNNTLDPTNVEVRWYDEGDKVYTTNGATLTQLHTSSNTTTAKLEKTMVVKTDDEICSKGTEVTDSVSYTVFKPVKFNLTSDASEFDVPNTKCLGQTSQGSQTSANVSVNLTQGNPIKFVWSDDIVWEWKWDGSSNTKDRVFNLSLGTNTLSVVAYDNVCNKEEDNASYKGENGDINIEARKPISVTIALASGRDLMCKGEEISLIATVNNEMPGEQTMLEWNEKHGVSDGLVSNGSYTTDIFSPGEGKWSYRVKASENATTPICPSQVDSIVVGVQVNTTLQLFVSEDAICQDTSGRDTVKLVKLIAHVVTGSPKGVIWNTGDTTDMLISHDTCYSFLNVAPMQNSVYSAYGYDPVCVKTTTAYTDEISVDHRNYVTLSAEDYKVQMGKEVTLKTEYLFPTPDDAGRHYEMVTPIATELERNTDSELNWQLDAPGRYQFIVRLENGNCGIRNSNIIDVDVADYVVVPNVITPYNDNPKNDKFMEGYDVKIFNRYQETVYEGTDGWDATYRGELASPGTYFYILTKKDGRVLKGTVEVYRK